MKILDQYILKKFLSTYFFVVIIMVSVLCVIDFTEKNDNFLRTNPGLQKILFDYYLNFIPYWANLLSPIMIFIATVFVNSRLAARTEIVAILSSGVSFLRFMVPYIIGATMVGLLIFYLTSMVIPKANKTRVAFENKYLKNEFRFDKRNVHFRLGPENYAYLESYNNAQKQGYQFTLEKIKGTKLVEKIKAQAITSINDTLGKWKMESVTIRIYEGPNQGIYFKDKIDTTLNLYPKDFESKYMLYETFTTPELSDYIDEMTARGADGIAPYVIERYLRYTTPFAIVILTVIGVILTSRKSREGPGFQIALGFILAFIYILMFMISRSIANAGNVNALLACWFPNIIFGGIGVVLYKTVPR